MNQLNLHTWALLEPYCNHWVRSATAGHLSNHNDPRLIVALKDQPSMSWVEMGRRWCKIFTMHKWITKTHPGIFHKFPRKTSNLLKKCSINIDISTKHTKISQPKSEDIFLPIPALHQPNHLGLVIFFHTDTPVPIVKPPHHHGAVKIAVPWVFMLFFNAKNKSLMAWGL